MRYKLFILTICLHSCSIFISNKCLCFKNSATMSQIEKVKITRRTVGAKGFNFLHERLDKKGLRDFERF